VIRIGFVVTVLLALAGCVVPFGKSTGPGDNRSMYFSNSGNRDAPAHPDEQLTTGQPALRWQ
jgi:hypothetical protein